MAKDIKIAGASYSGVPSILVPLVAGGTAKFIDEDDAGGGGSLPSGFTAIATGTHTLSADTNASWTVTHNLGATPDLFLVYRDGNPAQAYSAIWAMRCPAMGYRSTSYLNYTGYHSTNTTTTVSVNNGTTRCISAVTSTTATITYYSSTSYYWRSGTYKWLAIKFS